MTGSDNPSQRKRIDLIDALRGLAVLLMVFHHLMFDLVEFLGAPTWFFANPVFNFLHYIFAGVFIFLSGVSSQFSRSNCLALIWAFDEPNRTPLGTITAAFPPTFSRL